MRTLLLVILILALAVVVGKLQYADTGVLTIGYGGWIVETSPIAMLVTLVVFVLVLMILFKVIGLLLGAPAAWRNFSRYGKRSRAQKRLLRGYTEFVEGRWLQAEKQLTHAGADDNSALINHLIGARAAHFQGESARRDQLLEAAAEQAPEAAIAIDITRAEMQIDEGDYIAALETLVFLRSKAARNARVIKLLATVYHALQDWSKLDALLPVARRYRALGASELAQIERDCQRGMIAHSQENRLSGYWKRLPKTAQHDTELLIAMANRMLAENKFSVAEKLLRDHLNQSWDEELLPIYAGIELDDPAKQLDLAEQWVGNHGRSAALLLTLGQLCLRCQLWGKARVYLESSLGESSLGIRDSAHASLLLAELLTQLGEPDAAREYYAKGLRLALNKNANVALPKRNGNPSAPALADNDSSNADLKLVENKA